MEFITLGDKMSLRQIFRPKIVTQSLPQEHFHQFRTLSVKLTVFYEKFFFQI